MAASKKQAFQFTGPAGELQAELLIPSEARTDKVALVLHPHPLFQGTMDNKVVTTLCRAFNDLGISALRFNFRGVGNSEGEHNNGIGEQDDAAAAAEWLNSEFQNSELLLAGFSFGAATAVRTANRLKASKLISCGLPVSYFTNDEIAVSCPWLAVHGEADDVADWSDAKAWLSARPEQPQIFSKAGVGHFFHGELGWLRHTVKEFVDD